MAETVLITGAGGAIGSVVASRFAEAGWRLILLAHRTSAAATLHHRYPQAQVLQADLTNEEETRRALSQGEAPDAVLHIAGGFAMQAATEATWADLQEQFGRNFFSLFNLVRAVLPGMLARQHGFLLGVSAAPALNGGAQMGLYAASKAAVAAYLKSLQAEVEPQGVRVSILYPMGIIDTAANREAMPDADPQGWIDPQALADSILHLATRPRRGHIRELQVHMPG